MTRDTRSQASLTWFIRAALLLAAGCITQPAMAQLAPPPAGMVDDPIPHRTEGVGPFKRLILRGAYMIDGTGAPARGPIDLVVEGDRISEITLVGAPGRIEPNRRPAKGDHEIDLAGYYIMPGFIDTHVHTFSLNHQQKTPTDYILKLWLINGITSVRDLGQTFHQPAWLLDIKRRSERNEITAPRIDVYPFFANGPHPFSTVDEAKARIRDFKKQGVDGVKFLGTPTNLTVAGIEEARRVGLRTTIHNDQLQVSEGNIVFLSEHGLEAMEHWYGLPESMFEDRSIQHYSNNYVYDDEQDRFGEAGTLWMQAAPPGSKKWEEVMDTLLKRHFIITPTFVPYLASRDLWRVIRAPWQDEYTLPALWDYWRPNPLNHGSFWFDWTTEREMAWRENYRLWMRFINEYKNRGGLVPVGDDAGFLYNLPGFGFTQELELLREAGFTPLEVIRAATQSGARALGHDDQLGTLKLGMKADIVAIKGNPLANLKLLYPTGTIRLNQQTQRTEHVGGIDFIIKDGIVYDGQQLRDEVKSMVAKQKAERHIGPGVMPVAD
ncbi:MAG TPA: amidohydrolase family protein [Steroidobacteraceae bacterium]|nr:amidohydrolase family protein [Steroidobacteraceae bacterium]